VSSELGSSLVDVHTAGVAHEVLVNGESAFDGTVGKDLSLDSLIGRRDSVVGLSLEHLLVTAIGALGLALTAVTTAGGVRVASVGEHRFFA